MDEDNNDVAFRAAVHILYPEQPCMWGKWLPHMYSTNHHSPDALGKKQQGREDKGPPSSSPLVGESNTSNISTGGSSSPHVISSLSSHTCYIHLDLDCFYAQVEGERVGVDNDKTPFVLQQWGNLIAVNYPARARGIKRFHSIKDAREMCPEVQTTHVPTYSVTPFLSAIEQFTHNPPPLPGGASAPPQVVEMGVLPRAILSKGYPYQQSHYYHDPKRATHKVSLDPYRAASRRIFAVLRSHVTVSRRCGGGASQQQQCSSVPASALLGVSKAGVDEAFLDATEAASIEVDNMWIQFSSEKEEQSQKGGDESDSSVVPAAHGITVPKAAYSTFGAKVAQVANNVRSKLANRGVLMNTCTHDWIQHQCAPIMEFLAYLQRYVLTFTKLAGIHTANDTPSASPTSLSKYSELWRWVGDYQHIYTCMVMACSTNRDVAVNDTTSHANDDELMVVQFFAHACTVTASLLGGSIVSHAVRTEVKAKVGYNCSCGISLNRVIAKITSATFKPNQQTLLLPQNVLPYLTSTKVQSLRGFGGKLGALITHLVLSNHPHQQQSSSSSGTAIPIHQGEVGEYGVDDEEVPLFEDEEARVADDGGGITGAGLSNTWMGGGGGPSSTVPTMAESLEKEKRKSLTCGECWRLDSCSRDFYREFRGCEVNGICAFLQLRGIVNGDVGEPLPISTSEDLLPKLHPHIRQQQPQPSTKNSRHHLFSVPPLPAKSILANKVIGKTNSTPTIVAWIQCLSVEVAQRLDGLISDYAELVMDLLQHHMRRKAALIGEAYSLDVREEFAIRVDAKLARVSFNQSGYSPSTDYGSKTVHPPRRSPPAIQHRPSSTLGDVDGDDHHHGSSPLPLSVYEFELMQTRDYCRDIVIPFVIKAATSQLVDQCGPPPNWRAALTAVQTLSAQHHAIGVKRERDVSEEGRVRATHGGQHHSSTTLGSLFVPQTLLGKVTTINIALSGLVVSLVRFRRKTSTVTTPGDSQPETLVIDSGDCLVDVEKMVVVAPSPTSSGCGAKGAISNGSSKQQSTLEAAFSKAPVRHTAPSRAEVLVDGGDDDVIEIFTPMSSAPTPLLTSSSSASPTARGSPKTKKTAPTHNTAPLPSSSHPVGLRSVIDLFNVADTIVNISSDDENDDIIQL